MTFQPNRQNATHKAVSGKMPRPQRVHKGQPLTDCPFSFYLLKATIGAAFSYFHSVSVSDFALNNSGSTCIIPA